MARFRPLTEGNGEAIDVLCCVILGHSKVKQMMKDLKQPQSTVSEKLRFLIKSNVVQKDKWEFQVKWNPLLKILKNSLIPLLGKENKRYLVLFDDERLTRIMKAYAPIVVQLHQEPKGLDEILWMYLLGLAQTNDEELRKYGKRFIDLRKKFEGLSKEKLLFLNSED